jgi:Fe-S-cluster containining protein
LAEVKRQAGRKEAENLGFHRHMQAYHYPTGPFRILAGDIEDKIDCKVCANCCRNTTVSLSPTELQSIADFLRMTVQKIRELYTIVDPDDANGCLIVNEPNGCTFLDGNLCMIYDARPDVCRNFPHLSTSKRSLRSRMATMCSRAWFCPIIFNTLEQYKKLIGYRA